MISYCGCIYSNVFLEHLIFFFFLDYAFGFIICSLGSDQFCECNMRDTYLYLDNIEVIDYLQKL